MHSGRNPDVRRGIDKHGVYLTDPAIIDVLPVHNLYKTMAKEITDFDKEIIDDAMCTLTEREKDIFLMLK